MRDSGSAISIINVEILTLFTIYGCCILGAFLGGKVAVKLNTNTLRKIMGVALLIASVLMLMGKFNLMPLGGETIGLHGIKLVIAEVSKQTVKNKLHQLKFPKNEEKPEKKLDLGV